MGEGSADKPVDLALTVNPVTEPDDSGLVTYNWSLTNMGSDKAMFTALLLTFGDADFRSEDLVMVIDGVDLKPGAGNSDSGSFTVSMDWGEGDLNFAALAVEDKTGKKWLSNTVTFANTNDAPAVKTVEPEQVDINLNHLADGIYPVSFQKGDVFSGASGVFMNAVHIYTEDWYDIVDISTLKAGDSVVVNGETILVNSVEERDGGYIVNGGLDEGGVEFSGEEDTNGFCVRGYDDATTYTDHGVTTLLVDPAATYNDSSDIEAEPVTVTGADIAAAISGNDANPYFIQFNTTVRIENGVVVEINRVYNP